MKQCALIVALRIIGRICFVILVGSTLSNVYFQGGYEECNPGRGCEKSSKLNVLSGVKEEKQNL